MRRRARGRLTFLAVFLAFGGTLAAISAPRWVSPRWLGIVLAGIGWAVYASFFLGQVLVWWCWVRRPVAKRPWILGGPPNPSPSQDSATRNL